MLKGNYENLVQIVFIITSSVNLFKKVRCKFSQQFASKLTSDQVLRVYIPRRFHSRIHRYKNWLTLKYLLIISIHASLGNFHASKTSSISSKLRVNMPEKIDFVKMHGLGNDFVIVKSENIQSQRNLKQFAIDISNRRTGIGCDQFVVYEKIRTAYYNMTLYNIDGSFVKICGNAARCLAKLISTETGETQFTIKSTIKDLKCFINDDTVTVNMGPASFQQSWMPPIEKIRSAIEPYAESLDRLVCVDVANPHLVIFGNFTQSNKLTVGKMMQSEEYFEDGVNVSFVRIVDNRIRLFIWERGAGPTLACGSAACASFASSMRFNLVRSPCEVVFALGSIFMSEDNGDLLMTGATTFVAEGKYHY